MKTLERTIIKAVLGLFLLTLSTSLFARTEEESSSGVEFSTGADVVSSYVWRGVKYGGASIQPDVSLSAGGFSLGAWGSADISAATVLEMDLYASYEFDFGLSLGLTDYYYPGSSYFDYENCHWIEANLGYSVGSLSLAGNYMLQTTSADPDMYFELGYDFGKFGLAVGGGNGWHTPDGSFQVCNIAISTEKEIKVTDSFSIPISGSVILNPNTEQFYIVVAASF